MPEEKQILQVLCERAAAKLSETIEHRCAVTLFAFYKNVGAIGNAFASSLPDRESIALTIDATVSRSCGAPLPPLDPEAFVPADDLVTRLGEQCRDLLPFHSGFVLIVGAGVDSACTSFEDLEHMRSFLVHIALPQFKEREAVAPLPEGSL
jgi:hypothetical protein